MAETRDDGRLLTAIESDFKVERRAHGPAADGYVTIITWQANASGTEWAPVDRWELSPTLQKNLLRVLVTHPEGDDGRDGAGGAR